MTIRELASKQKVVDYVSSNKESANTQPVTRSASIACDENDGVKQRRNYKPSQTSPSTRQHDNHSSIDAIQQRKKHGK